MSIFYLEMRRLDLFCRLYALLVVVADEGETDGAVVYKNPHCAAWKVKSGHGPIDGESDDSMSHYCC